MLMLQASNVVSDSEPEDRRKHSDAKSQYLKQKDYRASRITFKIMMENVKFTLLDR